MFEQTNFVTPNTTWTTATHHGGLIRTMAEIQADQERMRRAVVQRDYFRAKDVCGLAG